MKATQRISVALLFMAVVAMSLSAQGRKPRVNFHGDVAEILTHEAGQLELAFTDDNIKRVRALRIDGPINGTDIKVIRRILSRGSAVDDRGKSISNYVDLDLRGARIVGGGAHYDGSHRTEHDVIGNSMFESCSHLRSIDLPDYVRRIEKDAFRYCSDLEEVRMPRGVREIGVQAFASCRDLRRVIMPDDVELIDHGCFKDCSQLRDLPLPRNLRELGREALMNTKIAQVNLPPNLTAIGEKAFEGTQIKSLYLPALVKVEKDYLGYMPMLEYIEVDRNSRNYTYEDGVLYDASGQVLLLYPARRQGAFSIPNDVTAIAPSAFFGAKNLTEVSFPASIREIGGGAFTECTALKKCVVPESVTMLGAGVFEGCKALTTCAIYSPISTLPDATFKGCASLQTLELPTTVTAIGPSACKESGLTVVTLPARLMTIDKEAFRSCKHLATVNFNGSLQSIGKEAFRDCTGLGEVNLPSAATIDKEAFRGCKAVKRISLPANLTSIGDNAFRDCDITTLEIPASVTQIGDKIAEKCKNLQTIVLHSVTPPTLGKVSNNKVQVIVPGGSESAYKGQKHWKEFKQISAQ